MSLKEDINKEKSELIANKKPYETAAFIIFAIMFIQQMAVLFYRLYDFIRDSSGAAVGWFNTGSMTTPVLFSRIVGIDNTRYLFVFLAITALVVWYFLHYLFVWNYCKKRGHAKWTWTLLVMFGPNLLFIPVYMFYAVYVFRPHFFRFIKTVVEEYKAYDPKAPLKEEIDTEVKEVEKKEKTIKKTEPKIVKLKEVEPAEVENKEE